MLSQAWKDLARQVRARDGNACRACALVASAEDKLQVHHRFYWSPYRPDEIASLVVLCRVHHEACHKGTPRTSWGLNRQTRRVLRLAGSSGDPLYDDPLVKRWGTEQGPDRITMISGGLAIVSFALFALFTGRAEAALRPIPCPPFGGPTCEAKPSAPLASDASPPEADPPPSSSQASPSPASSSPSSSVPRSSEPSPSLMPSTSSPRGSVSAPSSSSPPVISSSFDVFRPETWSAEETSAWERCMSGGRDMSKTDHGYRSEWECRRDLRALHSRLSPQA